MQINITYDASVAAAPAGFQDCVQAACAFFEQTYALPATITIKFSYGAMSALGTAQPTPIYANYADVRNALIAQGAPGASTLPANDPESGRLVLSTAEAKALGLDADNSGIDGTVTI